MIDLTHLNNLSKGNDAFLKEILSVYLENYPKDLEGLKEAYAKDEWGKVRYYAHKMKSTCYTIGYIEGYSNYQEIEKIIKEGEERERIAEIIDSIETSTTSVEDKIQEELKKLSD
ncbi:MAG: Hpt domain-containing protein [Flavobacteriales bacterium]|nr:Hpt domain-containing protein [Flavobacteriales bacterium]